MLESQGKQPHDQDQFQLNPPMRTSLTNIYFHQQLKERHYQ
jgi:hypothetical protein